jgi:uncharacterized damage-inducible protein DinB
MKDSFSEIFKRDLEKLKSEISLFDKEEDIWLIAGDIKNSPGNLCLHICGNLKHFIGYVIGGYDFIREREKEFSLKNVPREELLTDIDETIAVVLKTLNEMNNEIYDNKYPINVFNKEMTNEFFFIHLTTHLSYHLGQINYLRRLMIN